MNNPWPYFHRIEREILEISEYIHFDNYNENAFGERIAKLIIVIGSEIDTNLRIMTGGQKNSNMRSWKKWLGKWNPNIVGLFIDNALNFRSCNIPFEHLDEKTGYEWWDSYNSIKHNRNDHFELATISTLVEISSALFVVNCYTTYIFPQAYQGVSGCKVFYYSMPWGTKDPELDAENVTRYAYFKNVYPKESAIFPAADYFNLKFDLK